MFLNEIEPFAADWLASEYPDAAIDRRSIADVSPADLAGFRRVHFFAGIGGWEAALRLASWTEEREVWSGSCPCQPFSVAGNRKGTADERHLWPELFRLIRECRPATVFGEQVASSDGLGWLDGVFADLEGAGYACGAADLCAAGFGAPHIRQRLFWVANADGEGRRELWRRSQQSEPDANILAGPIGSQRSNRLEHAPSDGRDARRAESDRGSVASGCGVGWLGDTDSNSDATIAGICEEHTTAPARNGRLGYAASEITNGGEQRFRSIDRSGDGVASIKERSQNAWSDFAVIPCRDGKSRRVSAQSGDEPLAHGIPRDMGHTLAGLGELGVDSKTAKRIASIARRNRIGRLRGYGNAIVIQAAAEFIRAVMNGET